MYVYSIFISIALLPLTDTATCIDQYYNTTSAGEINLKPLKKPYCSNVYISVPNGNFVHVNCAKFTSFLDSWNIQIYDGSTIYDRQLYFGDVSQFCRSGKIVNSSRNEMLITYFHIDNPDKKDLFAQFNYNHFPASPCICPTHIFKANLGCIYSPLYENKTNYCNNLNCSYHIEIYEKYRISIDIQKFYTEYGKDILMIYDALNQRQIAYYSGLYGDYTQGTIVTGTNKVRMTFTTNSQITHRGFAIAYSFYQEKCACPQVSYVSQHGQLLSPGYPEPGVQCMATSTQKIQNCHYEIVGSSSQTVFLNFTELRLANGSYLTVYDDSTIMANYNWSHNEMNETMDQLTSKSSTVILEVHMTLSAIYNDPNQTLFIAHYWLVDHPKPVPVLAIILPIVSALGVAVVIVAFCIFYKKRKRKALIDLMQTFNAARSQRIATNEYDETSMEEDQVNDIWQISHNDISIDLEDLLGSGAFGSVYKAKLNSTSPLCQTLSSYYQNKFTNCIVAVKMLGELANIHSKEAFLEEILCMKSVGYCQYLVNMHGYCLRNSDHWLVLEYCAGGDLLTYVRNCEQNQDLIDEFDSFAWQIASGMEYLSSKQLVHRDLAARNVLLDDEKRAKIGDFGLCRQLSRDVYVTHGGRLPIKWMAIESIKDHLFTSKSDVWSYGVLLYEIYSFGKEPFEFVAPRDMIQILLDGERLEKPSCCSDKIYALMKRCWEENMEQRPTFEGIKTICSEHITETKQGNVNYLDLDDCT